MKKGALPVLLLAVLAVPALAAGVTFTSPAGGETWLKGTTHTIQYTYTAPMADDCVSLFRNGAFVGYIAVSSLTYEAGSVVSHPWEVGKLWDLNNQNMFWAPCGSGYTIRAGQMAQEDHGGFSNPFTIGFDFSLVAKIKRIYYFHRPEPPGCPQCLTLDLAALRQELVKLDETLAAGLYWNGRLAADLGPIGRGRGFAARLQVRLGADALAAVKRGEEFELRLSRGRSRLLHSQPVRLLAAGR